MRMRNLPIISIILLSMVGCGGGGSGENGSGVTPVKTRYSVNVAVTGVDGNVALRNGEDTLTVTSDGTYAISSDLQNGTHFSVEIISQPTNQTCGVMNANGTLASSDVNNIFVNCASLTDQSKILSATEVADTLASVDNDSLTFTTLPTHLLGLSSGDVIFSSITSKTPQGLLRKVVSVETVNDKIFIQTEDGVLTDLIKNGGFQFKKRVSAEMIGVSQMGKVISQNVTLRAATEGSSYCSDTPTDFVLDFVDKPISSNISISGCIGFNLDLDTKTEIDIFGNIKYFHFISEHTLVNALEAKATASPDLSVEYSLTIGQADFIVPIAGLPVPMRAKLALAVAVGGSCGATVNAGIGTHVTAKAGAIFQDGGIQLVGDMDPRFDTIGPEITKTASITASVGPEVSLTVAGVIGPQITLTPYMSLAADEAKIPWWALRAGVMSTLDLTISLNEIKGFGWLSNNWNLNYNLGTLFDKSWVISEAQGPYASGNLAPLTNFNFSPASPVVGQIAAFTNFSSDPDADILSWYWTFGDGYDSTQKNPTHSYSTPGNYEVTLRATDSRGAIDSLTKTVNVTAAALNTTPNATFSYSPQFVIAGNEVTFTNTSSDSDGDSLTSVWTFEGNQSSTSTNPTHVFPNAGSFTVILTVTDDDGNSNSSIQTITVSDNNEPSEGTWTTFNATDNGNGSGTITAIRNRTEYAYTMLNWDGNSDIAISIDVNSTSLPSYAEYIPFKILPEDFPATLSTHGEPSNIFMQAGYADGQNQMKFLSAFTGNPVVGFNPTVGTWYTYSWNYDFSNKIINMTVKTQDGNQVVARMFTNVSFGFTTSNRIIGFFSFSMDSNYGNPTETIQFRNLNIIK